MSESPSFSLLTARGSDLFNEGSHYRLCDKLGASVVSGVGNRGGLDPEPVAHHGGPFSLVLTLPPLSVSIFVNQS
jgi:hypothetical protein